MTYLNPTKKDWHCCMIFVDDDEYPVYHKLYQLGDKIAEKQIEEEFARIRTHYGKTFAIVKVDTKLNPVVKLERKSAWDS